MKQIVIRTANIPINNFKIKYIFTRLYLMFSLDSRVVASVFNLKLELSHSWKTV